MPILRVTSALEESASKRASARGSGRLARILADSSDFGFLESKVPQNVRFLAQDDDEPPCKI